jgi:hypothetical protein
VRLGLRSSDVSVRVLQQTCAALAAKVMTASMTASPADLDGVQSELQQLLSRLQNSAAAAAVENVQAIPDNFEGELALPNWDIIPIQTRREKRSSQKRKRKDGPSSDRVQETLATLDNLTYK